MPRKGLLQPIYNVCLGGTRMTDTTIDPVYTVELAFDRQSWLIYTDGTLVDRAITILGCNHDDDLEFAKVETEADYETLVAIAEARQRRYNGFTARLLRTILRRWGVI